jgi:hypothetical protein
VSCTGDFAVYNGWAKDHCELPVVDLLVNSHPDVFVTELLERTGGLSGTVVDDDGAGVVGPDSSWQHGGPLTVSHIAHGLRRALNQRRVCLARVPLGWHGADWDFVDPLDCLGGDGGGGICSGPGMAVGAALALRGSDRIAVAVLGDGDLLMGSSALWTAAKLKLPLLIVAANNGSYYNDDIHQQKMALARGRPVANSWVGQSIDDPRPDLAAHTRALGLTCYGPVATEADLATALDEAVGAVTSGPVFIDVHVNPESYGVGEQAVGTSSAAHSRG